MINAITHAQSPFLARPLSAIPEASRTEAPASDAVASAAGVSPFEAFARQYDLHAMTPREIDQMAEAMPMENPGDFGVKMMLLTRGEEWQRHMADVIEEATGVDQSEALAARLSARVDLIDQFQTTLDLTKSHGGPTEAVEATLAYLHRMDARRHMPEGGVRV